MAANSKHIGDIYLWILKIISSSNNFMQDSTCRNLIRNFDKLCERIKISQEEWIKLHRNLRDSLDSRFMERQKLLINMMNEN